MTHVDLATAKAYSKIYFADDDVLNLLLLEGAEDYLAKFLNRSLSDEELLVGPDSPPHDSPATADLVPALKLAVLMAFDEFYQNRGIVVTGNITNENPTWMRLTHLYRIGLGV